MTRRFISVQGNYYLIKDDKLLKFNRQAISDIYGKDKLSKIDSYDTFTIKPDNINHEEVVNNDWNLYSKLTHVPKKGEFKTIKMLMEHIFWEDVRMGYEYVWNLYVCPEQKLPGLGLVSQLNGTGKSTFLELMKMCFQNNAAFVDHEALVDSFNDSWTGKLVVLIDEKPDGKSALKEVQKLKKLITGFYVMRKAKYVADKEVPNFSKFIIASNDIDSVIRIEQENSRFWIIDVPQIKNRDHNIFDKLKSEVPAFLHYLYNEFKARPSRGRVYFHEDEFQNKASKNIQYESRSSVDFEIEALLERYHDQAVLDDDTKIYSLYFSAKDVADKLKKYETKYIRRSLLRSFNLSQVDKQMRYTDPFSTEARRGLPFKYDIKE